MQVESTYMYYNPISFRTSDNDVTDSVTVAASTMTSGDIKPTSPLKSSSQRRPKIKKNASTCTTTSEVGTITNPTSGPSTLSVVEIESDPKKSNGGPTKTTSTPTLSSSPEKPEMHIVNERHNGSNMYQKHSPGTGTGTPDDEDEDSENEKLSPLLSPGSRSKNTSSKSLKQVVASLGGSGSGAGDDNDDDVDTDKEHSEPATTPGTVGSTGSAGIVGGIGNAGDAALSDTSSRKSGSLKRTKHRPELTDGGAPAASDTGSLAANLSAEESDYYTPEDTQNTILSPLCQAERTKSGDPLCSGCGVANRSASRDANIPSAVTVAFSGSVAKKNQNLHKKSTSVGNIVGPGGTVTTCSGVDLKMNNVSSLPGR